MSTDKAVGIDLGTTYSVIAYMDEMGRPQVLNNVEGDKLTPSVVLFDGIDTVIGKEAVKAISTEADQVADCAKRDLGYRIYHKELGGRYYPPEAIQAWILNKLRVDAQRQIGAFGKVVVTVPAYFDEVRRKATQDAGYIAGFEVLDIINEPTAAAIAYGHGRGLSESKKKENILVYDLGGGTFDVTVMELSGQEFTALSTDGDVQLGGRDWDQRLMDFVAEEFIRQHGVDPREDANTLGRLWRDCEDAKRTLSARSRAVITCDFEGISTKTEVTREQFEDLTRDLLDRTSFTTRQTLLAAGLEWDDIANVLLVGGSSRMPAVSQMLKQVTGKKPDRSVSPDETVAHGAALHADLILQQFQGKPSPFRIKNVNSHSLGVVATDSKTKRARNAVLIPRNTPLPVSATRVFKTQKASQKSIKVQIVEGESTSPSDCSEVGKVSVRELPPNLPVHTPIEVHFQYEENGRLNITVIVAGQELVHELTRENSLTGDQLDSWRQYVSGVPW